MPEYPCPIPLPQTLIMTLYKEIPELQQCRRDQNQSYNASIQSLEGKHNPHLPSSKLVSTFMGSTNRHIMLLLLTISQANMVLNIYIIYRYI